MNARTNADILQTLSAIIVEALRVPVARVVPSARLFADLGSESIDILDIRFRMEQAFALKIEQEDIAASLGLDLNASQIREHLTVDSLRRFVQARTSAANDGA